MSQDHCGKSTIAQTIELKVDGYAPHTSLEITLGINGYMQFVERSGSFMRRFHHPVEVAPVCGEKNRWVLLSKGSQPIVIERTQHGWVTRDAENS